MTGTSEARFACDACGRTFRWKADYAGRKLQCGCGKILFVPAAPQIDSDGLYEFADDAPVKRKPPQVVTMAPASVPPSSVPSTGAPATRVSPLAYRQPTTPGSSTLERLFPDRVKDLYMPLALIGGGTVVWFGYMLLFGAASGRSTARAMASSGLEIIVGTALMLVAILIAGRYRRIDFGPLPVAVMKLCAVAIGPTAVVILAGPLLWFIPFGASIVQFAMFFALLGAMFDLDQSDTWYCVAVIFIVNVAVYFGMRAVM
jgi:hypothetical protein